MFGLIVAIHLSPITTSSQGDSTSSVRVITVRELEQDMSMVE